MTTTAIKTNSTLTSTSSSSTSNKQSSEEPPKKVNFSYKKLIREIKRFSLDCY
jgi:hypothetical protein